MDTTAVEKKRIFLNSWREELRSLWASGAGNAKRGWRKCLEIVQRRLQTIYEMDDGFHYNSYSFLFIRSRLVPCLHYSDTVNLYKLFTLSTEQQRARYIKCICSLVCSHAMQCIRTILPVSTHRPKCIVTAACPHRDRTLGRTNN